MKNIKKNKSGFTILEILLVSVLLFSLSYAVYLSVKKTMAAKDTVDANTEILQEFRSAYGLIERDLRGTFFVTVEDTGWYPRKPTPPEEQSADPIPPPPKKPTPITVFQGKSEMLFFSTRTHQRLFANAAENEEHFVLYQLKDGSLYRSESKHAITEEDRKSPEEYRTFVLINNVISLEFKFWNAKQNQYVNDWDSEKPEFLYKVPDAVQITIKFRPEFELEKSRKSKELILVTAVRIPEAGYRNIEWAQAASSSSAPAKQEGEDGGPPPP